MRDSRLLLAAVLAALAACAGAFRDREDELLRSMAMDGLSQPVDPGHAAGPPLEGAALGQVAVNSKARLIAGTRAATPPPWWVKHGVTPEGPDKDMGTWTAVTFSRAQQERFGVGEHGEVQDQAKLDAAVAAAGSSPATVAERAGLPRLSVAEAVAKGVSSALAVGGPHVVVDVRIERRGRNSSEEPSRGAASGPASLDVLNVSVEVEHGLRQQVQPGLAGPQAARPPPAGPARPPPAPDTGGWRGGPPWPGDMSADSTTTTTTTTATSSTSSSTAAAPGGDEESSTSSSIAAALEADELPGSNMSNSSNSSSTPIVVAPSASADDPAADSTTTTTTTAISTSSSTDAVAGADELPSSNTSNDSNGTNTPIVVAPSASADDPAADSTTTTTTTAISTTSSSTNATVGAAEETTPIVVALPPSIDDAAAEEEEEEQDEDEEDSTTTTTTTVTSSTSSSIAAPLGADQETTSIMLTPPSSAGIGANVSTTTNTTTSSSTATVAGADELPSSNTSNNSNMSSTPIVVAPSASADDPAADSTTTTTTTAISTSSSIAAVAGADELPSSNTSNDSNSSTPIVVAPSASADDPAADSTTTTTTTATSTSSSTAAATGGSALAALGAQPETNTSISTTTPTATSTSSSTGMDRTGWESLAGELASSNVTQQPPPPGPEKTPGAWSPGDGGDLYDPQFCPLPSTWKPKLKRPNGGVLRMTKEDDFMYQLGWLLCPIMLSLTLLLFRGLRAATAVAAEAVADAAEAVGDAAQSAQEAVADAAAAAQEAVSGDAAAQEAVADEAPTEKADSLAEKLYDVFWGEGRPRACIDAATIIGAVVNLVLFGAATEAVFKSDWPSGQNRVLGLSADSLVETHDVVEIVSVIGFGGVLLGRCVTAQAHPRYKRSGRRAWIRYLGQDFFAKVDVLAIGLSLSDFLWCRAVHMNWTWLCGMRTVRILQRRGLAVEFKGFSDAASREKRMISSVLMLGSVLWLLISGLFYLANFDNEKSRWYAAESMDDGEKWQRFKSIPSSMFFVLLNLTKKNPLAHVFHTAPQRALVTFVNLAVMPLFALPASIVGSMMGRVVMSGDQGRSEVPGDPGDQDQDQGSASGLAPGAPVLVGQLLEGPAYAPLAGLLGFGSVAALFASTARHSKGGGGEHVLRGDLAEWCFALIDGSVGAVFAVEWCLRVRFAARRRRYGLSPMGAVDFLSAWPGVARCVLFAVGCSVTPYCDLKLLCLARIFKLERLLHSFEDMGDVLYSHRRLLVSTAIPAALMLALSSQLLYMSEQRNPDAMVLDNFASFPRALWSEAINMNGEWVWADYTPCGKGVLTVMAIFSVGICVIPMTIFTSGYFQKIYEDNDEEVQYTEEDHWQLHHEPQEPWRLAVWEWLYGHLKPGRKATVPFRVFTAMSITLTLITSVTCIVLTLPVFGPADSPHTIKACVPGESKYCVQYKFMDETFKWLDWVAVVFFLCEFSLRFTALGWKHAKSLKGISGATSLIAIAFCLGPWRREFLHPEYSNLNGFDIAERQLGNLNSFVKDLLCDLVIPLRLFRLFNLEDYIGCTDVVFNVFKANLWPLARSSFSLVCTWLTHATLLHYFERESDHRELYGNPVAFVNGTNGTTIGVLPQARLTQGDRYGDLTRSLQYSLVHLTGDFPLTTYSLPSKAVLFLGTVMGMCTLASFTGIFSSGFVNYLAEKREEEARQIAERKTQMAFSVVLRLQRIFRRKRALRQQEEEKAADGGSGGSRPAREAGAHHQYLSQAPLTAQTKGQRRIWWKNARTACRKLVAGECPYVGCAFVYVCNGALLLNVANTLIASMADRYSGTSLCVLKDSDEWWSSGRCKVLFTTEVVEVCCVFIFAVVEFPVRVVASGMLNAVRVYDLLCIVPSIVHLYIFISMRLHGEFTTTTTTTTTTTPQMKARGTGSGDYTVSQHQDLQDQARDENQLLESLFQVANLSRAVRILAFDMFQREVLTIVKALRDCAPLLVVPTIMSLHVWVTSANFFMWFENAFQGPSAKELKSIPEAMYWTSSFLIGEWSLVDFSRPGAVLCILCCLVGMMLFAIPLGIILEAVQSALMLELVEQKVEEQLKGADDPQADQKPDPEEEDDEDSNGSDEDGDVPAAREAAAPSEALLGAAAGPPRGSLGSRGSRASEAGAAAARPSAARSGTLDSKRLQAASAAARAETEKLAAALEQQSHQSEAELLARLRARRDVVDKDGTVYEGGPPQPQPPEAAPPAFRG